MPQIIHKNGINPEPAYYQNHNLKYNAKHYFHPHTSSEYSNSTFYKDRQTAEHPVNAQLHHKHMRNQMSNLEETTI